MRQPEMNLLFTHILFLFWFRIGSFLNFVMFSNLQISLITNKITKILLINTMGVFTMLETRRAKTAGDLNPS